MTPSHIRYSFVLILLFYSVFISYTHISHSGLPLLASQLELKPLVD